MESRESSESSKVSGVMVEHAFLGSLSNADPLA
jgi:hypothetical protein